jgi:WhiB family transcriptional regulator, redox-sensing transcriptional regulator
MSAIGPFAEAIPNGVTGPPGVTGESSEHSTRRKSSRGHTRQFGPVIDEVLQTLAVLARDPLFATATLCWMPLGACREEDPELFFPDPPLGPAARSRVDAAKKVCGRCPVRAECMAYALATGQTDGIWGGATEQERRKACRISAQTRYPLGRREVRSPAPADS